MEKDGFRGQLAKVKEAYNIVDLVRDENIVLKSAGPNKYKGLCPFHTEKTPSFVVNEDFQNYRCFGCGAHGDIFTFIENIRGCSFKEAVMYLANMKNIKIDFGKYSEDNKPYVDIKSLYTLLADSYKFYRSEYDKLPNSHPAKQEVIKRGLDANNPVFCYAPERYGALVDYLTKKGYSKEIMTQSELVSEKNGKYYDFFYGRLMITLSDFSGRPVSYSARKLFDTDKRAKYVNGKQSPVFQKKSTLFNLDKAKKYIRESKTAIVCEGPFDVLALEASGIHNAVASCGTAFTEEQLRNLEQIIDIDGNLLFSFDGDNAGIAAAVKTYLHFPIVHGNSSVVLFPEGLDPCDYLIKYGKDKMKLPFTKKKSILDFTLLALANKIKLTDMQSKYKFARLVMSKYIPAATDKVLQDYMIRQSSVLTGIPVDQLKPMLGKKPRVFNHEKLKSKNQDPSEVNITKSKSDKSYIIALAMLVNKPKLLYGYLKNTYIPKKYKLFIRELGINCHKYVKNNEPIRIIPEQYTQSNFVTYLQNIDLMVDLSDNDEAINHFAEVLKIAYSNLKREKLKKERMAITQALSQAKSNDEIIKLLRIASEKDKEISKL